MALFDPLSNALAPLADGFLRHFLLRLQVQERDVRLEGVSINYYYRPAPPQPVTSWRRQALSVARRFVLRQEHTTRPTPIVLVHGLGDNALTWALVLELLAPGRDIYAIDLPGYGLSGLPAGQPYATLEQMRAIIAAFLHEVVGRPAIVVGNSLGAWLAVKLAQYDPTAIHEIVLLNAGGAYLGGRASWEPFREVVAVHDLKTTRLAIRQVLGFIPAGFIYLGQRSIQARFQRQVVRSFVAMADERDFLTPEDLQGLKTPVSLVWGLSDHFLPDGSLAFFQQHLPHAPTLLIARCGHLPQRERPLHVARFLDGRAAQADLQPQRLFV